MLGKYAELFRRAKDTVMLEKLRQAALSEAKSIEEVNFVMSWYDATKRQIDKKEQEKQRR